MVVKFNPAGQVTMVFGRKQEASDEELSRLSIQASVAAWTECSAR